MLIKKVHSMTHETITIDVSGNPELLSFAQEVQRSGTTRVLSTDGEALARISPITPRKRVPRGKRTSAADPIWEIVGMGRSGEPSNVSERVDEFLADWEVGQNRQ